MRPIVVEYIFQQSGISFLMKLARALPIPNFDTSLNEIKLEKAKETIAEIIDGIKAGDNFLIYPAGRLKHTGKEIVGGASATHSIISECPNVNIVLIRTTGLWGSSFSRAYTNGSPDFKSMVVRGIKYLFKAFVFFMPRRKVLIEIEAQPQDFPKNGTRLEINKYLENWYNRYPDKDGNIVSSEPAFLVSYSPFKELVLKLPRIEVKKSIERNGTSSKLEEEVFAELAKISKNKESNISLQQDLAQDLGLDSLDIAEVITFLSVHYEIPALHPEDLQTVRDVVEFAEGKKKIVKRKAEEVSVYKWPEEKERPECFTPIGKTIAEAFLNSCEKMGSSIACGDDLIGVLNYKDMKLAALAFSQELKKLPGKYVAILLPASIGAYLVIFATYLANKIPVMLNWTLGPRNLNHMMQVSQASCVITSWKFLERLSNVEFGSLTKKIYYLEDLKKRISKKEKILTLFRSYKSTKSLLKSLDLDKVSENDAAVILFTSGTEAAPKAVPLTHKNILSNQTGAIEYADLKSSDIFYGILPPFHSFGFSVAGILPILSGLKVAYFPDPTDSYSLAEGIDRWKITILCSAPSFLKSLLQIATKDQVKTIRLFVSGAEKTPKDVYEKVKKLNGGQILVEGYGITECAPIISINLSGEQKNGVGKTVGDIELCIINPETDQLIDKHKEGEICVKGSNVFSGYLAEDKNPFIQINNEKWYRTGDLGYLDKDGNLILSGRLKRFSKIAGEMVSLGAVEEVISEEIIRRMNLQPEAPIVAVCAEEIDGNRTNLILFTTTQLTKNEANLILKEAGFSNLVKISEVKNIDTIPLMGTGKIDYRYLQSRIE